MKGTEKWIMFLIKKKHNYLINKEIERHRTGGTGTTKKPQGLIQTLIL